MAERTVSRLMPTRRSSPSQTWRTFLTNHVRDLVSIDFFTVPTAHWRVLFGLDVRAHHRREVVHFNVTEHPPAAWTAQSIVEAFPDDTASSYLLRDRDTIYGHAFRHGVKGMGNRRLRFQNIHPAGPGRVEGRAIASGHTYPKWAGRLIKDELHKTGWRLAALLDLIVP